MQAKCGNVLEVSVQIKELQVAEVNHVLNTAVISQHWRNTLLKQCLNVRVGSSGQMWAR